MVNSVYNLSGLDESCFGCLSSLTVKEINGQKYLHFENSKRQETAQTMVVCVQNENFTPEIEVHLIFFFKQPKLSIF
jgi:hypothetical protein